MNIETFIWKKTNVKRSVHANTIYRFFLDDSIGIFMRYPCLKSNLMQIPHFFSNSHHFFGKTRTSRAPYMLILYSDIFVGWFYWYFHEISMFENYVGISHHLNANICEILCWFSSLNIIYLCSSYSGQSNFWIRSFLCSLQIRYRNCKFFSLTFNMAEIVKKSKNFSCFFFNLKFFFLNLNFLLR